jgi:hypothetical protein
MLLRFVLEPKYYNYNNLCTEKKTTFYDFNNLIPPVMDETVGLRFILQIIQPCLYEDPLRRPDSREVKNDLLEVTEFKLILLESTNDQFVRLLYNKLFSYN